MRAGSKQREPRGGRREAARRGERASKKHGRTAVVLFVCAGIAFLGLLAGGEHKEATAWRQNPMAGFWSGKQMPRYPGAREAPAGPASNVGGSEVKMSFLTTEDDPDKVARFYRRYWRARRLFVRDDVTHMGGVVSAVDVEGGQIYQALITVHKGRTMVFPSVTRSPLQAMESGGAEQPAPVPLFPESRAVINLGSKEADSAAKVSLSVNDGGLEPNAQHYSRELRARGYKEEIKQRPKLPEGQRVLLFRKGSREVTVNLTALDKKHKRVRVHIMAVGS
jgi:hypothetical protein